MLAPIAWRTPPRHYGPWEQFASLLTEGLVAAGHHVTLFATADSITTASLHATAPCGWSEDATIDAKVAECLHIASVFERAGDFDIIHNGFDFLPLTYSDLVTTPVVTTIHGFSSDRIIPVYERYDSATAYVSISDADRHPNLHYAATIHHGIDIDGFAIHPVPASICCSSVGSTPTRAPPTRSRSPADVAAGSTSPGSSRTRSTSATRSRRTSTASRCATSAPSMPPMRAEVLGGAHALLHLIDFDEPFGYSVVEAMACGTPVIANARGSMGELVEHGVTGFLVDDIDSAVAAVARRAARPTHDRPARRRPVHGRHHDRQVRGRVPRRHRQSVGTGEVEHMIDRRESRADGL